MNDHATLTLTDPSVGLTISVRFDRFDAFDRRPGYAYTVARLDGEVLASGDDLRGGCGENPNLARAAVSLLSFLSAAAESGPDGDNGGLFPRALVELLEGSSDDIYLMREWIADDDD